MIERVRAAASRIELWVVVVALVPIATAVARHSGARWMPIGDNALVELRARDVFTLRHFPFLGTWSSASITAGKDLNHPGPLFFDLLSVPVRVFGGATGLALGVGLINAAATVGVAVAGHRLAGRVGCVLGTLAAVALGHSMGSGMLVDPWNPHLLMLPFLALCTVTWGVAAGRFRWMPWLLAIGSLCVETHLSYSYLVPACAVTGLAGTAIVHRRRWRLDPSCRAGDAAAMGRTAIVSVVTLLVLWAQPLVEQFTGTGQGNLSRILSSTGTDEPVVGAKLGLRIVAAVVAVPPWWNRSSIIDAVPLTPYGPDHRTVVPAGMPSGPLALVALVVLAAVVAGAGVLAARRRDRVGLAAVATSACLLVVALGTLVIMPLGPFGLTPHQMRWLWPLGAFTWCSVALVLARWAIDRWRRGDRGSTVERSIAVGVAAVTVVVAALNVPRYEQLVGPDTFQAAIPVARDLSDQVAAFRTDGSVVLDPTGLSLFEPFSAVVMAAFARGGVDFHVEESGLVRQVGDHRAVTGDETQRVVLRQGLQALSVPDGMERSIAFASPLSADEVAELEQGEQQMVDALAASGVAFTEAGQQLIDGGAFGLGRTEIEDAALDPAGFVSSGLAFRMVLAGALVVPAGQEQLFTRTSQLGDRVGDTTVAVFVGPA